MSNKYKFGDPDGCCWTCTVLHWIDVFTRNVYKNIVIESLKYCQKNKGLNIHAYVMMTNHIHLIVSRRAEVLLEDVMRDMKKFTSSQILKLLQTEPESRREWMLNIFRYAGEQNSNNTTYQSDSYRIWKQDNHPVSCSTAEILKQKMDYLHENPVRAGFVEKAEDWVYSSAGDYYCGKKGLIEVSYV